MSDSPALALAGLAAVAAGRGRTDEASAGLADLEARARASYVSPVAFVMVHAALGQADQAFDWLERTYEERRGWLAYLNVEPMLDPLRGDPRLRRLAERMHLA